MLLTITKQGERPHPLLKLDYLYGRSHGTPQRTHRLQHHSDIFRLQTSLSLVHSHIMSILQSYLFSSSTMNITILREVIPISVIFWQFVISLIDFSEIGSSKISSTICAISYCRDIIIIDLILQYFSLPYWISVCQSYSWSAGWLYGFLHIPTTRDSGHLLLHNYPNALYVKCRSSVMKVECDSQANSYWSPNQCFL